jgi:alanine racemase
MGSGGVSLRVRALIYLDNLRFNIEAVRGKIGRDVKICMPVKADAYGHGALEISKAALDAGVEFLGVANVAEGKQLRESGIKAPLMVFSQAFPQDLDDIASHGLIPFVCDGDFIEEAAKAAKAAKKQITVHLKIDTGMGRLGCRPEDALFLAQKISSKAELVLGGVATHLSVSDSIEPECLAYTKEQLEKFRELVSEIKNAGINPGIVHAANSGGFLFHEDSYFDMVRPGIFLYGYSTAQNIKDGLRAMPLMELKSAVVGIKKAKKSERVSYGGTWTAPKDTFIGVIPAGYGDGVPRGLSNNHSILIRGNEYPVTGRICMDQFMVDLGTEPQVQRWDEAVIFGPQFLNAADIAEKLHTIPHEITCNVNKRVPREYV